VIYHCGILRTNTVVQKLCYLNIHGQTIYRVHAHFAAMNSELVLTWPLDLEERHA
jgi:hypothetical protein